MRIGIIGAGMIGATAARLFVAAGNQVAISNSRGPESLRELASRLGPRCRPLSVEEAARFGDIVLLAVPWRSPEALPPAEAVAGKVVIDAMNPYDSKGKVVDPGETTSSEETAKRLPGARIVKAFNTIYYKHLDQNGRPDAAMEERDVIFMAGDDDKAKAVVASLIGAIGFAPVDVGSLADGRKQQPDTPIYNKPMKTKEAEALLGRG